MNKHHPDRGGSERVEWLRREIRRHNELYYNRADPEIADAAYDAMLAELAELEKSHPEWDSPDSPTRKVGAAPSPARGKKEAHPPHRHAAPMLSIANTYSADEIRKFVGRVEGALKEAGDPEPPRFVVELKIDGVAVTAFYRDGKFARGATRGDGRVGEDITANLAAVRNFPKHLASGHPGGEIEVRGEIYMPSSVFARLVGEQEEAGAARIFANPRNAAAGTLKLLDSSLVAGRDLACFFYQVVEAGEFGCRGQEEALAALEKWGLPVNPLRGAFTGAEAILAHRDKMDAARRHLPYGTDGLVIKLDSFPQQNRLGLGTRSPNWAVAYKFEPERAKTVVRDIRVQVGKLGRLTPVADLEPAALAGTTITHASLHNESYIAEKDIRVGDSVLVEKAGEIIPQINSVVKEERAGRLQPFVMPTKCPSCGHESETTETPADGRTIVLRFCANPRCPAVRHARVSHFASRDAMDIEGMGPSVVQWLLDNSRLDDVSGIYRLTREQLLPMTKAGRDLLAGGETDEPAKKADNLLSAIETSKKRGLAKLLFALAIPDIGETAAQLLARHFKSLSALSGAAEEDIASASMGESTSYRTLGDATAAQLAAALRNVDGSKVRADDPGGLFLFLERLRLPGLGKKRAEAVARHFGGSDALLAADAASIAMVEMGASQVRRTLGAVAAKSLRRYLDNPDNAAMLRRLEEAGVSTDNAAATADASVAGKVFALTGTLPGMTRSEAKKRLESAGALVAGSVSGNVDYLVAGDEAGSKLEKARKLGIDVIDAARLLELLRGAAP